MKSIIVCVLAICAVSAVVESKSFELQPRIVGGEFAVEGQFPYQVSLRQTETRIHHCGASIISTRFLLTAAHCVQFQFEKPDSLYAVVGTIYPSENGTTYALDRISRHKDFDSNTVFNDIAFLRTAKTIVFNDLVQPIALASKNTPGELAAYVSGWGLTEDGTQSKYLKFAKTRTMSHKACYDYHKKFKAQDRIIDTSLCAFAGNGDGVCRGDSGGPLADWSNPKRKELIGVVSWAMMPCGKHPEVYARVFLYKDWILEQMDAHSD